MVQIVKGIYKLVVVEKTKVHHLEKIEEYYTLPPKLYGTIVKDGDTVINTFLTTPNSTGVLLTGLAGGGKTELAKYIANCALNNNIPVITIGNITPSIHTIDFLAPFANVVLLFDEFGKFFPHHLQDKMLSMFSGLNSGKKLFILTENRVNMINEFILNRPGRIRYHYQYDRIAASVIAEYCNDRGVNDQYLKDFLKIRDKSPDITFDHMKAIVDEHLLYPAKTFEEVISTLNVSFLRAKKYYSIESIVGTEGNVYKLETDGRSKSEMLKEDFDAGRWFNIRFCKVEIPKTEEVKEQPPVRGRMSPTLFLELEASNITHVGEDGSIVIQKDSYIVKLNLIER